MSVFSPFDFYVWSHTKHPLQEPHPLLDEDTAVIVALPGEEPKVYVGTRRKGGDDIRDLLKQAAEREDNIPYWLWTGLEAIADRMDG